MLPLVTAQTVACERKVGGRIGDYPPAIAVVKRGESRGGGFGIKDGINEAGRKRKVLVRQRIIAGFDPSRPSQLKSLSNHPLFRAFILNAFLLLILNVCRHFVRQPVRVPLTGCGQHALLGALGVTNVALLRPMR